VVIFVVELLISSVPMSGVVNDFSITAILRFLIQLITSLLSEIEWMPC
jgi:hypothetical protein